MFEPCLGFTALSRSHLDSHSQTLVLDKTPAGEEWDNETGLCIQYIPALHGCFGYKYNVIHMEIISRFVK